MKNNDHKLMSNRIASEAVTKHADHLIGELKQLIEETRTAVATTVNTGLTLLNWRVGSRIRQDVLADTRADYGKEIVATVARQLSAEYGKGWSAKQLRH